MAIINNFPVSDSELVKVYENPDVFPGLVVTGSNTYASTYGHTIRANSSQDAEKYQSFSISIIPIRMLYVKPSVRTTPSDEVPTIVFNPGHIYSIHRHSYSTDYGSGRGQGRYILKEDDTTILDIQNSWLQYTTVAFSWSLTNE